MLIEGSDQRFAVLLDRDAGIDTGVLKSVEGATHVGVVAQHEDELGVEIG